MRIFLMLAVLVTKSSFVLGNTSLTCDALFGDGNLNQIKLFGEEGNRSTIQKQANILIETLPNQVPGLQVAFPSFIKYNPNQSEQFGDGQKNAISDFGTLSETPFIAILNRIQSELTIELKSVLPNLSSINRIEIWDGDNSILVDLDLNKKIVFPVDIEKFGWNQLYNSKWISFRPEGWQDWFTVSFPQTHIPVANFLENIRSESSQLGSGESIIDPLKLKNYFPDYATGLRNIPDNENLGYILARVNDRVHGLYENPNGTKELTSTGGIWTRYRIAEPFKTIYLVKDPRNEETENKEGVVSGTGPHYIGATAEIILNTIVNKPLMTFYGVKVQSSITLPNGQIAWHFSHIWIGTWLQPGDAFVAPQGSFHWHLNHTQDQVTAQVFTPPSVPSTENFWGIPKK